MNENTQAEFTMIRQHGAQDYGDAFSKARHQPASRKRQGAVAGTDFQDVAYSSADGRLKLYAPAVTRCLATVTS